MTITEQPLINHCLIMFFVQAERFFTRLGISANQAGCVHVKAPSQKYTFMHLPIDMAEFLI